MNDDGDEKIDGRREYVKWQITVLPTNFRNFTATQVLREINWGLKIVMILMISMIDFGGVIADALLLSNFFIDKIFVKSTLILKVIKELI